MKKKLVALVLTAAMSMSLLAGCGGSADEGNSGTTNAGTTAESTTVVEEGDPYEITMQIVTWGQTPAEIDQVEAAINEITLAEINATVALQPVAAWDLINESQLAMTNGEKMDIVNIFIFGQGMDSISNYTSKNMILPLNDLVDQYGADIKNKLGDLLDLGLQGTELYAIPSNALMGSDYGLVLRKDYLDDAGITIEEGKYYTAEEAEEIFLKMLEVKGAGYYGPAVFSGYGSFDIFYEVDFLGGKGDYGAILDPLSGSTTVVNLYESEAFEEYCKMVRRWTEEGIFNPGIPTMQDDVTSQMQTGYYMGEITGLTPETEAQLTAQLGTEMVTVPIVQAYASTTKASQGMYAISRTSENPEKAMQFLNMLYSDGELGAVCDLLNAGLEGVSYTVVEDLGDGNKIVQPEGDSMWSVMVPAIYGDALYCPKYVPIENTVYDDYVTFNAGIAERIPETFGYVFDPSEVSAEAAAVSAVVTQYMSILGYGSVDPETTLPEFRQALKDAGIDDVIAANQAQLDAWLAAK